MIAPGISSVRREALRRLRAAAAKIAVVSSPNAAYSPNGWGFGSAVGAHYGDNSAAVHRLVRQCLPTVDAWWAINRDSPDVAQAEAVGPVVFRDEVSTVARALRADALFLSHGIHDVPGADLEGPALRVRLGHGLTALKRTKAPPFRTVAQMNQSWGLVPVSSEFEKENKTEWGIAPSQIVVTGVPRFDDLVRLARAAPASDTILYMPTWRDGLPRNQRQLQTTKFYSHIHGLLTSPELHRLLEQSELTLEVYVHRLMHHHAQLISSALRSRRVRVLPIDADVQVHLASAKMLITDYSSVTWDMLYLDRPVVFYHFDVEEYMNGRGAYFDLRSDMPGPVAHAANEVVEIVRDVVGSRFSLSSSAVRWQQKVFNFRDTNNCSRVVAAVCDRLGRQMPECLQKPSGRCLVG